MQSNIVEPVLTVSTQTRAKRNARMLKAMCVLLPAAAMGAAHYFPWRRHLQRDLSNIECYAIGTAAIVGTASLAISQSDGDRDDHVVMLWLSAVGAGLMTLGAYAIDGFAKLRGQVANLEAQAQVHGTRETLYPYGTHSKDL